MPEQEDYEDDDDELTSEEQGFLKGYKDAQKKPKVNLARQEITEEFEDELLEEE